MNKQSKVVKITIIGSCNVGKTSLLQRFMNHSFKEEYQTTIGADFLNRKFEIGGEKVTAQIWDTAGNPRHEILQLAFYPGTDICVVVFDVTNRNSFEELKERFIPLFIQKIGLSGSQLSSYPLIIVGNKADLVSERAVPLEEIREWVGLEGKTNYRYYELSCKDDSQEEEGTERLVNEMVELFCGKREIGSMGLFVEEKSSDEKKRKKGMPMIVKMLLMILFVIFVLYIPFLFFGKMFGKSKNNNMEKGNEL